MDQPAPRIVTCADAKFFDLAKGFEENIFKVFGTYPIIVDIGFTPKQASSLKSPLITVQTESPILENDSQGFIRASHKARSILKIMEEHNCSVLLLDTDMVITSKFDFDIVQHCDIAVTRRHRRERRLPKLLDNGNINTGFLFFANNPTVKALLEEWKTLCETQDLSDQKLLSDLLSEYDLLGDFGTIEKNGLRVKKLKPNLYNDVSRRSGYIYHIKGGGRAPKRTRQWLKLNAQARKGSWLLKLRVALWRIIPAED